MDTLLTLLVLSMLGMFLLEMYVHRSVYKAWRKEVAFREESDKQWNALAVQWRDLCSELLTTLNQSNTLLVASTSWQPMDTAPKSGGKGNDGPRILAVDGDSACVVLGWWDGNLNAWYTDYGPAHLTHWMPIPDTHSL